ncbi:MAG TPA: ACT domain-containing protein [Opitutaceae bacterium]|nr:ACT domain-containing protein [Opitutaceae bacterium]
MKITQLSVFLENRPGRLSALCRTLADAGVNLSTLMLSDNGEFGLLRLLTPDVEKARSTIAAAGYAATTTEVVALQVPDQPGGLAGVLVLLEKSGVSVEYMYAFAERPGNDAVMVLRFDNTDKALVALSAAGIAVFKPVDLFKA